MVCSYMLPDHTNAVRTELVATNTSCAIYSGHDFTNRCFFPKRIMNLSEIFWNILCRFTGQRPANNSSLFWDPIWLLEHLCTWTMNKGYRGSTWRSQCCRTLRRSPNTWPYHINLIQNSIKQLDIILRGRSIGHGTISQNPRWTDQIST